VRKYIIVRSVRYGSGLTWCKIEIHKFMGQESGIPVYEHYKDMPDFPKAAELISKLEEA
jgi:hypothetical protein